MFRTGTISHASACIRIKNDIKAQRMDFRVAVERFIYFECDVSNAFQFPHVSSVLIFLFPSIVNKKFSLQTRMNVSNFLHINYDFVFCFLQTPKCVFACWQEGIGGSYRLASLDRLANRQRLLEQNNGLGQADAKNGISATDSNVNGNGGGFTVGVRNYQFNLSFIVMFV